MTNILEDIASTSLESEEYVIHEYVCGSCCREHGVTFSRSATYTADTPPVCLMCNHYSSLHKLFHPLSMKEYYRLSQIYKAIYGKRIRRTKHYKVILKND